MTQDFQLNPPQFSKSSTKPRPGRPGAEKMRKQNCHDFVRSSFFTGAERPLKHDFLIDCTPAFQKGCDVWRKRPLPCVGDGLPADWRDELDGELLLLRINVALICRATEEKQRSFIHVFVLRRKIKRPNRTQTGAVLIFSQRIVTISTSYDRLTAQDMPLNSPSPLWCTRFRACVK